MKKAIIVILVVIAAIVLLAVAAFSLPRKTFLKVVSFSEENICKVRGGTMLENGYNPDGNLYKCVVPYRDSGKACSKKTDCLGHCVVSTPVLPEVYDVFNGNAGILGRCPEQDNVFNCAALNPTGTCQKFELLNGRNGWELNDGKVSYFFDTMGITP